MAERQSEAQTPKKRRVKNPETFRERAMKANADDGKTPRTHRVKKAGGLITAPVRKPVRRLTGSKLWRRQPFRSIGKMLRFVGKIIWPAYFRNSLRELKLVTWPDWKQSRRLTYAVLGFAIVFGASIAGLDWVLDKVFKAILLK